ncbi:tyrosine-type recombinase/integrase [Anaerosporobacter sp.]|uniref:tyrosine-type recombinase/integrase n=1 Tax=Anaerosporobacter sp. TaxID=1872529 RepID=UPI00286F814C|nr:site-specific integrase [Anaerosporobacter sp.]
MNVKKNEKGLWDVQWYTKNYQGKNVKHHKRNFPTKKAATEYVEQFNLRASQSSDMTFQSLYEIYIKDMEVRLRYSTLKGKKYMVELKILPYFGKKKLTDITPADIRLWQQDLMKKGFKPTYLKTINNQMAVMMKYACRYYGLKQNPCEIAGSMGKGKADEMDYYTLEEFEEFVAVLKDKPTAYYALQTLYWTGMRCGELLALTIEDIDFDKKTLTVNKSLQRIDRKEYITDPKTHRGKRVIALSDNLIEMLQEYMGMLYGMTSKDHIFQVSKSYLENAMARGAKLSGVKKIRLHDLRHSHASLLISKLDAKPLHVAQRLGHERINTTLGTYAHMYPNQAEELAEKINEISKLNKNVEGD